MRAVVTVLGEVAPDKLGFCHSHEHLAIADGYPATVLAHQRIDDMERTAGELEAFRRLGGRAVVDAQPTGCCRDPEMLEALSRRSGIHVIASAGFHKMTFYPEAHWIYSWDQDRLARLWTEELTRGMYIRCDNTPPKERSGIRAGQLKAALDEGTITPQYLKLFGAAAQSAVETGAAMMVHIEQGSDPVALADFLQREGVPSRRLIFCHMDRSVPDLSVHKELCGRGIYLEYDTVGRPRCHSDEREAEIVLEMLAAGFAHRLLMSLDVTKERLAAYGGKPGLCHIRNSFLPLLTARGVTREQAERIFMRNPTAVFAREV